MKVTSHMLVVEFLLIIVLMVPLVWGVVYLLETKSFFAPGRVVYMGSNLREQGEVLVELVTKYVPDPSVYTLVEPGAGLATVSTYLSEHFTWKKIEAIELRRSIIWLAKVRLLARRNRSITYLKADLFTYKPKGPTVYYCYLTTAILEAMQAKGQFNDCLVICLTFEIPGVLPVETVTLKSWQGKISVYDFRENK